MSATSSFVLPKPDHAVLRWCESPTSPSREETVDILQALPSEALIRSALQLTEKTRVYLIKNGYTRIGIVKSCSEDDGRFLVDITMAPADPPSLGDLFPPDPGVLAVDDFLSEEDEERILSDLDAGGGTGDQPLVPEEPLACQAMADLNHLLCGITRTPAVAADPRRPHRITVH